MEYSIIFLSITLANLLAWLSPGPNMIAVISASATQGRTFGLLTGLGLSASATLWAALAVWGIEVFFEIFPNMVFTLRLMGVAYLSWLGLRLLKSTLTNRSTHLDIEQQKQSKQKQKAKAFMNGFLISASNPKAALFYGSILTTLVPENAPTALLISIVCLCSLLAIICHSITATIFSTPAVMRKFKRMQGSITTLMGTMFLALGIAVAIDTLRQKVHP